MADIGEDTYCLNSLTVSMKLDNTLIQTDFAMMNGWFLSWVHRSNLQTCLHIRITRSSFKNSEVCWLNTGISSFWNFSGDFNVQTSLGSTGLSGSRMRNQASNICQSTNPFKWLRLSPWRVTIPPFLTSPNHLFSVTIMEKCLNWEENRADNAYE